MKTKKADYKGAQEELPRFIEEVFGKHNKVEFLVSERGNQRIEIQDTETKEVWQTLEAVEPEIDMSNYDDISAAIMSALIQQLEKEE